MRIFLAGHRGMVGGAIARQLKGRTGVSVITRSHAELDLKDQAATAAFFADQRPDVVILAAARVGGILANNDYPADFIYDNLMIEANVIHQAYAHGVTRLLNLGSSCIYPRDAAQPMREDALLTGPLELTNEPYAIAKIAGIKLCESYNLQHGVDYRSVMPTNLYGPGDNFDPVKSHVLPGLMQRFHHAAQAGDDVVEVWGSGAPKREFLHVDDMAAASLHVLDLPKSDWNSATHPRSRFLNVGTGQDISIGELATMLAKVTGYKGQIAFDGSKPDGTPRKLLDVARLADLGWSAKIGLREGIAQTYDWYQNNVA
ncbi:MAG: NAD-dependent epimerase/dehydratase family protein [Rhodobacteraceae bacterium]|nr:NAD-dependent epimerase/dehydratase family protein [Paracoccaceae bacterium]